MRAEYATSDARACLFCNGGTWVGLHDASWDNASVVAPINELSEWERLLAAERHLQYLIPGATLVGGTAAALHARHRISMDGDHVIEDLRDRFDPGSGNARGRCRLADRASPAARPDSPAELDGVPDGNPSASPYAAARDRGAVSGLRVPTLAEMARIKAWLARRRGTRYGTTSIPSCSSSAWARKPWSPRCDRSTRSTGSRAPPRRSPRWPSVCASAAPADLATIDLRRYRALQPPWSDWAHVVARGRHWAEVLARVVLEAGQP